MSKQPNIPVPEQMVVNTGEQDQVAQYQQEFFASILQFLPLSKYAREKKVRLEYRVQSLSTTIDGTPDPDTVSDNSVTTLIVCDVMVASVLQRRTEPNHVEASFAHYITYETLYQLRKRDPDGQWRDR